MRKQFVDAGCRELGVCPSAEDFKSDLQERVDDLAVDSSCDDAEKAFYVGLFLNLFGGMGCKYDLNAIGLDEYGIDACELGRVEGFSF